MKVGSYLPPEKIIETRRNAMDLAIQYAAVSPNIDVLDMAKSIESYLLSDTGDASRVVAIERGGGGTGGSYTIIR